MGTQNVGLCHQNARPTSIFISIQNGGFENSKKCNFSRKTRNKLFMIVKMIIFLVFKDRIDAEAMEYKIF